MTHQLSPISLGYVDKRRTSDTANGDATISPDMYAAVASMDDLDQALLDSTVGYTQKQLNTMTLNDKVMAARTILDQGSLDVVPADFPPEPEPEPDPEP